MDKKFAKEIYSNLKLSKLHFNISIDKIGEFSKDCAEYIIFNTGNAKTPALKWCMSTVKKTKVFTQICYASSNNLPIYKEELAKKIPEYSYKTLATIVDEGIEKGYYITEEPQDNDLSDKNKISTFFVIG